MGCRVTMGFLHNGMGFKFILWAGEK